MGESGLDGLEVSSDAGSIPASSTTYPVSMSRVRGNIRDMATWKVDEGELTVTDQDVILQGRGRVAHIDRSAILSADVHETKVGCMFFVPLLWPVIPIVWAQVRNKRTVHLRAGTTYALSFTTDKLTLPAITAALALPL